MLNYDISRMDSKAEFGKVEEFEASNYEGRIGYFVPQFTVWAGIYSNTQTQTYDLLGAHINVDLVIAIRHNSKVNDNKIMVFYKDVFYKITNINSDGRVNGFDLLTLQRDKSGMKHIPSDTSKLVPYGNGK